PETPDPVLTSVDLTHPPPIKQPALLRPPATVRPVAVAVFTNPLIVENQQPPKPVATVAELNVAAIGIRAEAGPPATGGPDAHAG
ncbi:MAG TPA: hypothetical protein VGM24_10240, partial [Puia sp.]